MPPLSQMGTPDPEPTEWSLFTARTHEAGPPPGFCSPSAHRPCITVAAPEDLPPSGPMGVGCQLRAEPESCPPSWGLALPVPVGPPPPRPESVLPGTRPRHPLTLTGWGDPGLGRSRAALSEGASHPHPGGQPTSGQVGEAGGREPLPGPGPRGHLAVPVRGRGPHSPAPSRAPPQDSSSSSRGPSMVRGEAVTAGPSPSCH